jgi:hypothetical protein
LYRIILLSFVFIVSCSQLDRKPSSLGDDHLWRRAADKVLRYLPQRFTREELLSDKEYLYRLMGAIELNKEVFDGIPIANIPSRFFSGEEKERYLQPYGEQLPFESWDGSDNWGLTFSIDNIREFHREKITIFPDSNDLVQSIFKGDNAYFFNGKTYLLPSMLEPPEWILEATRAKFFQFEHTDLEDWSDQYFNKLANRTYTRSREYFSAKYLNPDFKQFDYCPSTFYFRGSLRKSNRILDRYVKALEENKEKLKEIMNISNDFYNELAALAIGVLLVESRMGRDLKYHVKEFRFFGNEWGQNLVSLLKYLKGNESLNSRGLTQIKIKDDIERWVKDTEYESLLDADYKIPENAALATIFVLREKLNHLQSNQSKHNNIDQYNWSDYLYYFYYGRSREITRGTATPNLNIKIRKIINLKDIMYIFENCES